MLLYTKAVRWHTFIVPKRLIVVILFYLIMLAVLPLLAYMNASFSEFVLRVWQKFKDTCIALWKHKFRTLAVILIYVVAAGLCILGAVLYSKVFNTQVNIIIKELIIGIVYLFLTAFFLRKEVKEKPEKLFFCITMIAGMTFILACPVGLGITWDDDTHYERPLSLATYADETGYEADDILIESFANNALQHQYYSEDARAVFDQKLNDSFAKKTTGTLYSDFGLYSICYVPEASGMILGRALDLPYTWIITLARMIKLLFYAGITALGIRKLKFGKILASTLTLIPTMTFMASCFSYDPWVMAFLTYGFCTFFSFIQDKEKKMTRKDVVLMLTAFILGVIPKAIYFSIMFPLFLMPKSSFSSKKEHHKYLFWLLLTGLFLVASFLVPLALPSGAAGDARGGEGVSAVGQIQWILADPGAFFTVMGNTLKKYLDIRNGGTLTEFFAYLGQGFYGRISATVLIILVALFDQNNTKTKKFSTAIVTILSYLLTVFLSITALYISFNPVGSSTVEGFQFRYMIPLLFPLIYTVFPDHFNNKLNKVLFNSIPMLFMAVTFLLNTLPVIASLY
jgi:uncharacterized membrane protein